MKQFNRTLGKLGEYIAEKYLFEHGYQIIEKNYSTKFGEIDLIVSQGETLRFVEVKLKKGDFFGTPEEMIGANKLGRVQRMAQFYLLENPDATKIYQSYAIDAVCIVINQDGSVSRINLYENIGFT
jgi:putative endonuclease